MTLNEYIQAIKLQVTGGVLENELNDNKFESIVRLAMKELLHYYDSTCFVEAQGSRCIDLAEVETKNNIKIASVSYVYRSRPVGVGDESNYRSDPISMSFQNTGAYGYGSQNWLYNYMAHVTTQKIANTISTDLDFIEDKKSKKLYVNYSVDEPSKVTIEYVPEISEPEDVTGEYWSDMLLRLSLAHTKVILGRIRTRFTQGNALQTQDGEKMLEEGTAELTALREQLEKSNMVYPSD